MSVAFRLWLRSWYRRKRLVTSRTSMALATSELLGQPAFEPLEEPPTRGERGRGPDDEVGDRPDRRQPQVVEDGAEHLDEARHRVELDERPGGHAEAAEVALLGDERDRVDDRGQVEPDLQQ